MDSDKDNPVMEFNQLDVGTCSDIGMVRSLNEDRLLVLRIPTNSSESDTIGLFAIADGMGGYSDGHIASHIAIEVLGEQISSSFAQVSKDFFWDNSLVFQSLNTSIRSANNEIVKQCISRKNSMATTLIAALQFNKTMYIANIGDSRAYCLKHRDFHQITVDHSLVAGLVLLGEIQPEEANNAPNRNVVTRFLGTQLYIEPDYFTETLTIGESFLLCSDGLWGMVKDEDIKTVLENSVTAQQTCIQLKDLANANGGADNISIIVIKVTK